MSASVMEITFTEDLAAGAVLSFNVINDGGAWGVPVGYTSIYDWVTLRSAAYQVTAGTPTAIPGERAAINFVTAFNLDSGGMYIVTRPSANVVRIVATNQYSVTEFYETAPGSSHDPSILFNITNGTSTAFSISSITYSQSSSNPCSNIDMIVTTNELATKVLEPELIDPNTNNPFTITVLRSQTVGLKLENATGYIINELIDTPPILNVSNFTLQINNSPNGATVIVNSTNSDGLNLEYSLDNSTWQTSNVFNGLAQGDYILYVKDQYGCSFTKDFTINEFGVYVPYAPIISKSNSFRFARRIVWGDSENYKNDENTLSCEADVEEPWMEVQQFNSADVIPTQFDSNYAVNSAKVIREGMADVILTVNKKTNNIGKKDKRDARKYDLGNGKTGIYFLTGNTYDYDTDAINGTHAMNGLLPDWGKIGEYVKVDLSWFQIEEIIFDEDKNAEVLVISNIYSGPEVNIIAGSIYNLFDYEVYEFVIDMNAYIDQKFRVEVVRTDPHFTTVTDLSELIWCKIKHENVLEIAYYNTTNTEIMYSTGIKHKIRIPYTVVRGKDESESEINKTDTDTVLLSADIYESEEFVFEPVTKEIWRKIKRALSHEIVTINGVGYTKNGDYNTEGPLGKSNLYVLTATMIKTGNVYNSQTTGLIDFDTSSMQIPGLIETDSGFVKY
jgi:hypothetical protein